MTDIFENVIEVGCTVAFVLPHYRELTTGIIVGFTPKMVKIEYFNNWNYNPPLKQSYKTYPKNVVVKNNENNLV